jgi:hypothetical protein
VPKRRLPFYKKMNLMFSFNCLRPDRDGTINSDRYNRRSATCGKNPRILAALKGQDFIEII